MYGIAIQYMPDYLLFVIIFGPAYFDTWTFYETAKVREGGDIYGICDIYWFATLLFFLTFANPIIAKTLIQCPTDFDASNLAYRLISFVLNKSGQQLGHVRI